jgi:hypothetical protein
MALAFTARQGEYLTFIHRYTQKFGVAPSFEEIGDRRFARWMPRGRVCTLLESAGFGDDSTKESGIDLRLFDWSGRRGRAELASSLQRIEPAHSYRFLMMALSPAQVPQDVRRPTFPASPSAAPAFQSRARLEVPARLRQVLDLESTMRIQSARYSFAVSTG